MKSKTKRMVTWTAKPHSVLINTDTYQLIQIDIGGKMILIANIHMPNNPKLRKLQIDDINLDINLIRNVTKDMNMLAIGDFNAQRDDI